MSAEKFPVTLLGGPHDGMALDVDHSTNEVRRNTFMNRAACYVRTKQKTKFKFTGYADKVNGKKAK